MKKLICILLLLYSFIGFVQSNDDLNVFITGENYCGNRLDTIFLGKRPVFTGVPLPDTLSVIAWTDSLTLCKDSAWITMVVYNNTNNPTNNSNTLDLWHSNNLVYQSGDLPDSTITTPLSGICYSALIILEFAIQHNAKHTNPTQGF